MNETKQPIGVRWTLGDVSDRGYEALRLSLWGAYHLFGPDAAYAVCYNNVPRQKALDLVGPTPPGVVWHDATNDVPEFIKANFEQGMAEGVGWKLAPLRFFPPDRHELSLDNDCILWSLPAALQEWQNAPAGAQTCVMAEDVKACFGQFEALCPPEARNAGIRGLPPGFDLEAALRDMLAQNPVVMTSELDEQGLQTAALSRHGTTLAVTLDEVTICSPFWPHLPHLGTCGAHFVGTNARHIPWNYYDRPADEVIAEHWARHRDALYEKTKAPRHP